jgi:hypothetical protein
MDKEAGVDPEKMAVIVKLGAIFFAQICRRRRPPWRLKFVFIKY